MEIAALAKRDKTFNDRAQFLGLWQGCHDLFMFDQSLSHVAKQHLAMLRSAVQFPTSITMTHCISP
jgi:hypothetical protein